jgi:peroxiredoxin
VEEVLQVQPQLHRWEDKGVKAFIVCIERDAVIRFMERHGMRVPALLDERGRVHNAYGVDAIPHSIWIDRQGNIRKSTVGWRQQHLAEFNEVADFLSQ